MNKLQRRILLAILATTVIMAALYYFGYVKLPNNLSPIKEKTRQELMSDFRDGLSSGALTIDSGKIVKINGKVITIKITINGESKEQNFTLADNVLIRRLTAPEIKPGDELVPMIETFITPADLRVGDNVLLSLDRDNGAVMIDVMPAPPSQISSAINEDEQIAGDAVTVSATNPVDGDITPELLSQLKDKISGLLGRGEIKILNGIVVSVTPDTLVLKIIDANNAQYNKDIKLTVIKETLVSRTEEDAKTKQLTQYYISISEIKNGDKVSVNAGSDNKALEITLQ